MASTCNLHGNEMKVLLDSYIFVFFNRQQSLHYFKLAVFAGIAANAVR